MPDQKPVSNPGWWHLHLWQIQPLRDVLVILAVFGVLYLGYQLSPITVPMLLAMMLAYLCEPIVEKLTSIRNGKFFTRPGVAFLLIFATLLLVIVPAGFGLTLGVVQGVNVAQKLTGQVQATIKSVDKPDDTTLQRAVDQQGPAWAKIRQTLIGAKREHERLAAIEKGEAPAEAATQPDRLAATLYSAGRQGAQWLQDHAQMLGQQALDAGGAVASIVAKIVSSIGSILFGAFLTAFFFFYFCTRWGSVLAFWRNLIPERKQGTAIRLLTKMDRVIAGFIRGRLTICAILVVYYTLGYWIIGVPAPLVLGPIVGLLCILPFIGQLGIPVSMFLLWLTLSGGSGGPLGAWQSNWWWIVLGPLLVHGFGQILDDYILTPRIQGDTTGMDTPTILFASISGGLLAGFYGLLVAIPVAACLRIVIIEIVWPKFKAWAEGRAKDPLPVNNG